MKEVWLLVLGFFMFFSDFPVFSLVLEPRDRTEGLGGKIGNACEEFQLLFCCFGCLVSFALLVCFCCSLHSTPSIT